MLCRVTNGEGKASALLSGRMLSRRLRAQRSGCHLSARGRRLAAGGAAAAPSTTHGSATQPGCASQCMIWTREDSLLHLLGHLLLQLGQGDLSDWGGGFPGAGAWSE